MTRPTVGVGLLLLAWTAAAGQTPGAERSLGLVVENDLIALRGAGAPPDYDYTHGTRVGASWGDAPSWLRRFAGGKPGCRSADARERGCVTASFEVGQEIYTPRRDAAAPVPGERPYSGWLYAAGTARMVSAGRLRTVRVALGVTGKPSLAAEVQDAIHHLLRNERQLGWAHQIAFEPGVTLGYEEHLDRDRSLGGARVGRLGVSWGAIVGNVRTALHAGVSARVGTRGGMPWVPGDPGLAQAMRLYLLAGYRQDLVLRDLFVDGNTLRPRVTAERRTAVGQYELGAGLRRRRFTVEYRHVARGREYRAQPGPHAYGSFVLSVHRL